MLELCDIYTINMAPLCGRVPMGNSVEFCSDDQLAGVFTAGGDGNLCTHTPIYNAWAFFSCRLSSF
jgi:hypothetical protein